MALLRTGVAGDFSMLSIVLAFLTTAFPSLRREKRPKPQLVTVVRMVEASATV